MTRGLCLLASLGLGSVSGSGRLGFPLAPFRASLLGSGNQGSEAPDSEVQLRAAGWWLCRFTEPRGRGAGNPRLGTRVGSQEPAGAAF